MSEQTLVSGQARKADRPRPEWCRGECVLCGEVTVSNCYYQGGKGYLLFEECWAALGPVEERTCNYRRQLL